MLLAINQRHVHYDLVGAHGAPTICLTHSLMLDGGMWAKQIAPLLDMGFSVLRLDMQGHGGSDPAVGPTSIESLASDVLTVMDTLNINEAHLMGLSIGGMIAQAFAINSPSRLKSLILCDTLPASLPGARENVVPAH